MIDGVNEKLKRGCKSRVQYDVRIDGALDYVSPETNGDSIHRHKRETFTSRLYYLKPVVAASLLLASAVASAVPVAGYVKQAAIYGIALAPTDYSANTLSVALSGAQASASSVNTPLPSVAADASVPASWPASTFYFAGQAPEAQSALTYYFTITGPSNIRVPINIAGTTVLSETNTAWSSSQMLVVDSASQASNSGTLFALKDFHCAGAGLPLGSILPGAGTLAQNIATNQCGTTNYSTTLMVSAFANPTVDTSSGSVSLEANVKTFQDSLHFYTDSSASAYIDPIITIDLAFATTHPGYSIAFSQGIGNVAPVPVPAAAWLLGSGLLGLIGVARRKSA